MSCPLCHSDHTVHRETIPIHSLRKAYKRLCGHDIQDQYNQDIQMIECRECDLTYFDPLIPGNEEFYNSLQLKPWYYSDDKAEFRYAANLIDKNHKVLEVGSGKGAFASLIKCQHYTGLDFSVLAKELASKRGIEIINESVQDHAKNHANEYDIACSFQVMEHVDDIQGVIKAQLDCLKPGGKLIIAVPAENSYLHRAYNLALNLPPHHMSRWSNRTFEVLAKKMGIELLTLHQIPLQPMHYHDYSFNLAYRALRKITGHRYSSIDFSLKSQVLRVMALLMAKVLKSGFYSENLPAGHTVIAVYQK